MPPSHGPWTGFLATCLPGRRAGYATEGHGATAFASLRLERLGARRSDISFRPPGDL